MVYSHELEMLLFMKIKSFVPDPRVFFVLPQSMKSCTLNYNLARKAKTEPLTRVGKFGISTTDTVLLACDTGCATFLIMRLR